jgi:hypothetical protein
MEVAKKQDLGAAALALSERGWRVFPLLPMTQDGHCTCKDGADCVRPGKHPRIAKWQVGATIDADQITEWWRKWPDSGIGIATGKESNLSVLDIDPKDGGDVTLSRLQRGKPMPATLTVITGSGGLHYYFQFNEAIITKSKAFGTGIDTRSEGGYVVAPPSPHATGNNYKWQDRDADVDVWPAWLSASEVSEGDVKKVGRPKKEKFNANDPRQVAALIHALSFLDPKDYDRWIKIGLAIGRAFAQSDEGLAIYSEWSARAEESYNATKTRDIYSKQSKEARAGVSITVSSIFSWAMEAPDYQPLDLCEARAFNVYDDPTNEKATIYSLMEPSASAESLFVRDGMLWRVVQHDGGLEEEIEREAGSYVTRLHDAGTIAIELNDLVAWWNDTPKGYVRSRMNRKLIQDFTKLGNWPRLKHLKAFVSHPTLRRDGSVVMKKGYDAASRLYLTEEIPNVLITEHLNQQGARGHLEKLYEPFAEYRWDTGISRSVFLSALFTVGLRHLFPTVPLFGFSAPERGSGKTMLMDTISLIWFGHIQAKASYVDDPDEMEKRIASFLMAGDRVICFDNVPLGLSVDDPKLNAVLTSTRHKFRILGKTESVDLDNNATFFLTGNSLRIVGDLARRVLLSTIDPGVAHPSRRTFNIPNLREHVKAQRGSLLGSALSCVKAYMDHECPKVDGSTMGSFEEWFTFMRNFLLWLGEGDLAEAAKMVEEDDSERTYEEDFVRSVFELVLHNDPAKDTSVGEIIASMKNHREVLGAFQALYIGISKGH